MSHHQPSLRLHVNMLAVEFRCERNIGIYLFIMALSQHADVSNMFI